MRNHGVPFRGELTKRRVYDRRNGADPRERTQVARSNKIIRSVVFIHRRNPETDRISQMYVHTWFGTFCVTPKPK